MLSAKQQIALKIREIRSKSVVKERFKSLKDYSIDIKQGLISKDVLHFDVNKVYDTIADMKPKISFERRSKASLITLDGQASRKISHRGASKSVLI